MRLNKGHLYKIYNTRTGTSYYFISVNFTGTIKHSTNILSYGLLTKYAGGNISNGMHFYSRVLWYSSGTDILPKASKEELFFYLEKTEGMYNDHINKRLISKIHKEYLNYLLKNV